MDAGLEGALVRIGYEVGSFLARRKGELWPYRLSPRQLEILQAAADGLSTTGIAAKLVISPSTVKTHFEHIYTKLGVSDRCTAVARSLREGLIQ
jgi:DNA-binding NarL/FixJ family response regulator